MTTINHNYFYDGAKEVTPTSPPIVPPPKSVGKHAHNLIFYLNATYQHLIIFFFKNATFAKRSTMAVADMRGKKKRLTDLIKLILPYMIYFIFNEFKNYVGSKHSRNLIF